MLDLLIQIGNKIKFNVNDYKINVIDELRNVNYKASTPIGSLDCNQIQIVPKTSAAIALDKMKLKELEFANQKNQHKSISTFNKLVQNSSINDQINTSHGSNGSSVNAPIPFQTTFRVQVNLPYNQRTVFRVKPATKISEIKEHVCEDRNLNQDKYQLIVFADLKQKQHPQLLEDDRTIAFYAVNEMTLISNKNLERMQMQNEINDINKLHGSNQSYNNHLKNSNLKSIVNSQSTASSVPRKAIISLLSATNQLEADCDYSNNICTRNKCVCNLSSINSPSNCQKRFSKSDSSSCLNRIGRRKKAQAPLPPTIKEQNNLKRSHSNHSLIVDKSPVNSEQQFKIRSQMPTKIRHNSGSDSSGYHECLSNSPNNQFGGSMINLSNNSLTISPILQQRLTSTPSSKQFRSSQHLNQNHKKRKAPLPPISQIQRAVILEQKSDSDGYKKEEENNKENIRSTTNIKIVSTTSSTTTLSPSIPMHEEEKNKIKNDQNEIKRESNYLNLELKREDYSNETAINNKKNLKSNSFKSDSSSGHSSGHSSSNSPELNEKDEIRYENSSSNGENSLEVDGESNQNCKLMNLELNRSQSKLAKENSENRFLNSKSPTSVASEPIYATPRTFFNNQSQGSESSNSFVMLNLEEQMRPSSAPNYCEEENQMINKTNKEIQIQNENSKDSGIFLKDTTINGHSNGHSSAKSNSVENDKLNNEIKQVKNLDEMNVKVEDENKVEANNVTTLIINVNDSQDRIDHKDDIKSISTLIESGDLIIDDQQLNSPTKSEKVIRQANCSTSNIAPPSCAMTENKIEEKIDSQDNKDNKLEAKNADKEEMIKSTKNEHVYSQPKSRISNIKEQFEQQSTNGLKSKIKLKLNNFKIGSYSTNQAEEDIYSDNKTSIYLPPYQVNLVQKQPSVSLSNEKGKEDAKANVKKPENLKDDYDEEDKFSKPVSPIKKPIRSSLNTIKFNEVSLNEGLSGSLTKLNNINNAIKETDNFNSDEFNDNQEFSSLYLNDNGYNNYTYSDYQPDRTAQNLCGNISMITPQPYKPIRSMVPRKLFYSVNYQENANVNSDLNSNQTISTETKSKVSTIPEPPSLPANSKIVQENKFKISSSNSFKEDDKLKNTMNYLVSDQKRNLNLNNNSKGSSECHDVLMNEIRTFGGRNSLKKVR